MTQSTTGVRTAAQMRGDALAIWKAGVDAVGAEKLIHSALSVDAGTLLIDGDPIDLAAIGRMVVVGGGKAGAGMAAAVEEVLGPELLREKRVAGWVNVPEDCVRPLKAIRLHPARAAGHNEPTAEGCTGAEEILRLVGSLGENDLCLCLISGGASALLPAPAHEITLADKQDVTRFLSAAGANIEELNTVRKKLSRIKGGGLLRACRAGRLETLVISDVPGDPLDMIGSGPTVPDSSTPADALAVLEKFDATSAGISPRVLDFLRARQDQEVEAEPTCTFRTHIVGNNAVAVDAAGVEAERLGYSHAMIASCEPEAEANQIGRHLAREAAAMHDKPGPDCLISGGEPVVTLCDEADRGKGGRNQQLVLAALEQLANDGTTGVVILSGGTDGEDGPTDAAGAMVDDELRKAAQEQGLAPSEFLRRNDAYHFFEPLDGLIKTGPTDTNVSDLRVVLVERRELKAGRRLR